MAGTHLSRLDPKWYVGGNQHTEVVTTLLSLPEAPSSANRNCSSLRELSWLSGSLSSCLIGEDTLLPVVVVAGNVGS